MKIWQALLLTFSLLVACALILWLTRLNLFGIVVVGTSVWAGIDSAEIRLSDYKSGISYKPVTLGILCSMFWIVAFPWYLAVRYKIKAGKARLRPECDPAQVACGHMGPSGLIQPWRHRRL